MEQRTLGVDIIAEKRVGNKEKEIVARFAKTLSPDFFVPEKTHVKFAGAFPTRRIRISLMVSREADPRIARDYLEAKLTNFLDKNSWVESILINRITLEAQLIKKISRTLKPSEDDILSSLDRVMSDLIEFFRKDPAERSPNELDRLIESGKTLLDALRV